MNAKISTLLLGLCVVAVTAACASLQTSAPSSSLQNEASPATPPTEMPTEEQLPPTQPATAQPVPTLRSHIEPVGEIGETGQRITGEAPQALLEAILDDAAMRTGLDRSELVVVQDEAVVWADGSLGCPEPGMMYTMALVDGYHVIVQAGEQELDYRAGRNSFFRLCENPTPLGRSSAPTR